MQEANLTTNLQDLTNIEAVFEILIAENPRNSHEIRQLIMKAWLNEYITEAACRRLIGRMTEMQRR